VGPPESNRSWVSCGFGGGDALLDAVLLEDALLEDALLGESLLGDTVFEATLPFVP
jgi:hypothetical protein